MNPTMPERKPSQSGLIIVSITCAVLLTTCGADLHSRVRKLELRVDTLWTMNTSISTNLPASITTMKEIKPGAPVIAPKIPLMSPAELSNSTVIAQPPPEPPQRPNIAFGDPATKELAFVICPDGRISFDSQNYTLKGIAKIFWSQITVAAKSNKQAQVIFMTDMYMLQINTEERTLKFLPTGKLPVPPDLADFWQTTVPAVAKGYRAK